MALADVLDSFDPDEDKKADHETTLDRLGRRLGQVVDEDARASIGKALDTLRQVRRVRHGFAHSSATEKAQRAMRQLGVRWPDDGPAETWETLRRRAGGALATLRREIGRLD